MESYREMRERHQREFNQFPLTFAYSVEQMKEVKKRLGVTSNKELYTDGNGMYWKKEDNEKLIKMCERNSKEMSDALHNNDDFLYEAIRFELGNHEFCITGQWEPTLEALGLTRKEICENDHMREICNKAMQDYLNNCKNE